MIRRVRRKGKFDGETVCTVDGRRVQPDRRGAE